MRGVWRPLVTVAYLDAPGSIHGSPCFLLAQPVIQSFLPVPGSFLEKPSLGMSSCATFAHLLVAVLAILSPLLIEGTGFPPSLVHPQNPHKKASHTFRFDAPARFPFPLPFGSPSIFPA